MNPQAVTLYIDGIGLTGPGLPDWPQSQDVLRGDRPHAFAPTVLAPPARLPPAERRRAGPVVRLTIGVADAAVAQAGVDPARLATVFSSSGGEGANCHALCEALAAPSPMISPTRFTNSVHNAASGYWHIAVASQASSTSLCAYDGSFGVGLLEAASAVPGEGAPVLLVAYDVPYPEPLHATRPIPESMGLALLLSPQRSDKTQAMLQVQPLGASAEAATTCADASLEALRRLIPAAAALPLLELLARRANGSVVVDAANGLQLRLQVESC
jgi:hypothetical protein